MGITRWLRGLLLLGVAGTTLAGAAVVRADGVGLFGKSDCDKCPPPFLHRQERPPRLKVKKRCPKPICDPCSLPHAGYYRTCWHPWPWGPDWSHCLAPTTGALTEGLHGGAAEGAMPWGHGGVVPPAYAPAVTPVPGAPPSGPEELPAPDRTPPPMSSAEIAPGAVQVSRGGAAVRPRAVPSAGMYARPASLPSYYGGVQPLPSGRAPRR